MFERKTSLVAFQELDFSRKQIMDLNEKLRLASTFSKGLSIEFVFIIIHMYMYV